MQLTPEQLIDTLKYLERHCDMIEAENERLREMLAEKQEICEIKQTRIVAVQDIRTLRFHRL